MKIGKIYSVKKIIAKIILLIFPAAFIGAYILWNINNYYGILENQWQTECVFLAFGLLIGCIYFSFRFRFITTTLLLLLLLFIANKIVNNVYTGEFTSFYAIESFYIFSFLFSIGWLAGWAFARLRWFPVVLSVLLLVLQIITVSTTTDITTRKLMMAFAPVLLFSFYIIYTAELIRNMNDDEPVFPWFIFKKLIGFGIVTGITLLLLFYFYKKDFNAIEKQFGGKGQQQQPANKESLTKENKDGTISNRKEMGFSGGRSTSKRLLFVAKLDNYFPDSDVPNPLYFNYDYYTKFDTLTQTLETDTLMPSNDLFQPDPSKIPLYFTEVDSNAIKNSKGNLLRKVVSTDVYKVALSPTEFLAPSTAFFCQPIAIDKEYKEQFKSAYRAKMYVSDLNSAYFVYNPAGNQVLEKFQDERFNALRKIKDWSNEDSSFISYYTFIPKGDDFDSVKQLAIQITKNATTPIDKIIAVRDYFLSKDETGQPLYKYTDNPGIPGLPSASKLNYFLFENRKGYCAYFAGATLFLLRSLGIPARVATGFLTIDRSTKNRGWYWFYEDQAHAWTQVYFPGYGWLDFDTTIPSTEQQQAPAPDGTPPITGQTALFVAFGKVNETDTIKKRVTMTVSKMIYHDKTFEWKDSLPLLLDVSMATITRDSGQVSLSELKKGNVITALSFSEQFKNLNITDTNNYKAIFEKIPQPAPIDEIKITDTTKEKQPTQTIAKKNIADIRKTLWLIASILLLAIIVIFIIPWLLFKWYNFKSRSSKSSSEKAYWYYITSSYYLNQIGYTREKLSPLEYAYQKIDAQFKTNYASFMQVFLKTKYSKDALSESEENLVNNFYKPFYNSIKNAVPVKQRLAGFLNISRTIQFFSKPKI